jgi:murein DD-endopeptidase MepM/ murein hydrolase activator NlpD
MPMIRDLKKVLLGLIICLCFFSQTSYSSTISDLQNKIDAYSKSKEALEQEIKKYQVELNGILGQANSLQNTIKSLDLSSKKLASEIKLTQNNIDQTTLSIGNTGLEISSRESDINKNRLAIRNILREVNKNDKLTIFEVLLKDAGYQEITSELESLFTVQSKVSEKVDELKEVKSNLEVTKLTLEQKKKKLEDYNKELANQKLVLSGTIKEKNNLLAQTKNTQANYEKILADKKALRDAFDRELVDFEAQLRIAIDPKSYPSARKGILAWPVDNVRITQNFGYTNFAKTAYATGYHNGMDFGVSIGTRVKSAGNGVVEAVGDTDTVCPHASFGKWVFIRYDNGLASTYAHLSLITSRPGQKVKTGDVVGYSGNTGYSTGPHLHMSVYAGQGVTVTTRKSAVCSGSYTLPIADPKGYLDPALYL